MALGGAAPDACWWLWEEERAHHPQALLSLLSHWHHVRLGWLFFIRQVQRAKQDLENKLEAEQECLVNKLQAQMMDMQLQNRCGMRNGVLTGGEAGGRSLPHH